MRAPSFWWRDAGLEAALLAPFAAIYGAAAARRLGWAGARAGVPVLCVGNPTLGGAGKTPAALAIARILASAGERPVFLTRGYGGRLAGPLRVDRTLHGVRDVGDEPLLLARAFPTIVAHDRVAGARAACAADASVIVMDDGFQNPSLAKDGSILVIDGPRGIGNGRVFPAGPLRAPMGSQIGRAHAVLIVREGAAAVRAAAAAGDIPLFRARLEPELAATTALAGRRVLAFAGIADPDKFFETLAHAGIEAPVRRPFPDHHRYTPTQAARLLAEAQKHDLLLVTTEKDLVRLDGDGALGVLRSRACCLPVALVLDDESAFRSFLLERIRASA